MGPALGFDGLAQPERLVAGVDAARVAFASLGVELAVEAALRRVDLATDIHFADGTRGQALLDAMAGLHLPGHKQRRHAAPRAETVEWLQGRRIALRFYDAGAKHETHGVGERLRLERQLRFRKDRQRGVRAFTTDEAARTYVGSLRGFIDAAPAVRVATPAASERLLIEKLIAGDLSLSVAERQIGVIRLHALGVDSAVYRRDIAARRVRSLRKAGIALDLAGEDGDAAALDVGQLLRDLAAAWAGREVTDR